jgi:hypothetical protein
MLKVATGAYPQYSTANVHRPALFMLSYPGVFHCDSRAKYAVAFFKMSRPILNLAFSALSLASSICSALTGLSPAPQFFETSGVGSLRQSFPKKISRGRVDPPCFCMTKSCESTRLVCCSGLIHLRIHHRDVVVTVGNSQGCIPRIAALSPVGIEFESVAGKGVAAAIRGVAFG